MKHCVKITFILIIAYGFLYLYFFWQTPLGQTPVLDGSGNISLARQIANGTLSKEPFFRSMLYPALLSIPCFLGFDTIEELFTIASLSGMIFHFISTLFVFLSVKNLWNDLKAAIISSLIYGLYPPAIFFAGEPLDATISICFLLSALYTFLISIDKNDSSFFALSGLLMGITGLLRSNLLPFAIIYIAYPIVKKLTASNSTSLEANKNTHEEDSNNNFQSNYKKDLLYSLISIFCLSILIVLNGIICYLHSGDFRFLPWQGPANLYSANCLKSNGRYFRQTVYLLNRQIGDNPQRLEAEYIYSKETGKKIPYDIDDFNKFWRAKCFSEIKSDPIKWLKLILKKTYYLYNNYEQYDNKTFSFQKELSPSLRYNPLCFGMIIILVFIFIFNYDFKINKNKIFTIAIGIDIVSLGIIAFYVCARFRLSIVPLLVILCSGIFTLKKSELFNIKNLIISLVVGFITFSTFFDTANTSTWKEDRLLNAFACSRLALDEEQIMWADKVLEEEPTNLQAIRLKLVGFTNLVLEGKITNPNSWTSVRKELSYLNNNDILFNDTMLLSGCYAWKFEKNKEKAFKIWIKGSSESLNPVFFRAFLIYTGLSEANESDINKANSTPLLAAALESKGIKIDYYNKQELIIIKKALDFFLK